MAFLRKKDSRDAGGDADPIALENYKVVYKGGHPDHPKAKSGEIRLVLTPDEFQLNPTVGSQRFWHQLHIPYQTVSDVQIVGRQVSTTEALLGGLDSRQLNQNNNIHIHYRGDSGVPIVLRLEMLSGITVQGQARKCLEFEDRLRNLGIRAKFLQSAAAAPEAAGAASIPEQIAKLASLRDQGILSETEFEAKKADLLERM